MEGIGFTFQAIGDMIKPSSLAQYLGVLAGDTDVDEEIRPVSPIGIVNIGTQTESAAAFLGILAFVNVILATISLLPSIRSTEGTSQWPPTRRSAVGRPMSENWRPLPPLWSGSSLSSGSWRSSSTSSTR